MSLGSVFIGLPTLIPKPCQLVYSKCGVYCSRVSGGATTSVECVLHRAKYVTCRIAALFMALACAAHPLRKGQPDRKLSKDERVEFFRDAQVWTPATVGELDLRMGPQRKDAFMPDEVVDCQFVETKPEGSSKKFHCKLADGDVVKVRYGTDNGEVEGSVLASRLLWALGFGSDAAYPVRVVCHGCSDDPWNKRKTIQGTNTFDIATIERKEH